MKFKIVILLLMLFLSPLGAQEKQKIPSDYSGLSFLEFVKTTESLQKIRFYYKEEWIKDLVPGDYPGTLKLTEFLDNLFRGTSLYYYIDKFGNIVLTKYYEVRISKKQVTPETSFIPPTDYGDPADIKSLAGNQFVEIGNPAERNLPGNVVVSGYIIDRDTKYPVAGATVFIQRLKAGTISNAFGYYSLSLPRGIHSDQFSFVGMREQTLNLNLSGTGEMNVEMNSVLIP